MLRIVKTILICFFICSSVLAETSNLELKLLNGGKKEVDAGVNMNVLIMITNRADTDKEVQIRLNNNEDNLKLIADYSSIHVDKRTSISKIIGIQIPYNIKAGTSTIKLEAIEKTESTAFGEIVIPINIKPRYEIAIIKLKSPQYVFSGDTLSVYYSIENLSNLDAVVNATVINGTQTKVSELKIPKGSSTISRYFVSVPKNISTHTQQSVIITAAIVDKPETEATTYISYDVFPSQNVKFDKYERFPIKVSGITASTNRYGKNIYSSIFDIQGLGTIGSKNDKKLDIHLRGPDRTGDPLFGLNDEYYLKYDAPRINITLGDYNYGLSNLTESSRNGRGVRIQYNTKKWSIGSYYNSPRYYPLIKQIIAVYSDYNFNPKNGFSVGALTKVDSTNQSIQLYTLSAFNSPFRWLKTDGEVAFGQNLSKLVKAYRGSLQINFPNLSSNVNYMCAEPNFPGFVSNSLRLNSGITYQFKKVTISANYDQNSTNMALDTLYSNMPFSKNISLTSSFRITPQNSISLGGYVMSMKDQSPNPLFDYKKTNGRLSVQSKIGHLNMVLMGDFGKMENLLDKTSNKQSLFYNGTLSMIYFLNKDITASSYGSYQGGQQMVTGYERFYYGGSLMGNIKDRLAVTFQYNSNYEWRYYTSDRSLLSLNLDWHINANNDLSLMGNYNLIKNTLDAKEYNIQLRYAHTIHMPVAKKKDVGSVNGMVINHGVDKVNGIRLSLNGIFTITDKNGNFKFPVVPIGNYVMFVDASSFGLDATTEIPGPFLIKVEAGKVTNFDFAMTKSGRIAGRIIIQEDERVSQKGFIPVKEQLDKLIIEASNGTEVFRVYTDQEQAFRFNDLRPGNWEVKVYSKGLPQGYQLVKNTFNIILTSGKEENIDVFIKKKARQIQFQKTL
ncbi:MAG: hypothetical protein Q8914_01915 [Bacteroidota bacterium]|nr:hypothetical protein [Bacteroidota bacterium]